MQEARSENLFLLMTLGASPLTLMQSGLQQVSVGPGIAGNWTHIITTAINSSCSDLQHVQGE